MKKMNFFKRLFVGVVFLAAFAYSTESFAQLGLSLETNSPTYLLFEPVYARIIIVNHAGYPLAFADDPTIAGKVTFLLENSTHFLPVRELDTALLCGFVIPPGGTKEIRFTLSKYADLRKVGVYKMRARISHTMMQNSYLSEWISFNVLTGQTVAKRLYGAASRDLSPKNINKIVERTVSLKSLNVARDHLFYLLIEDDKRVYCTKRIAYVYDIKMKSYMMVDPSSQIHILVMASPKIWVYQIFTPDGEFVKREILAIDDDSPLPYLTLEPGSHNVVRVGGRIARKNEYTEDENHRIESRERNPQLNDQQ